MTRILSTLVIITLLSACSQSELPVLTDAHDRYLTQDHYQASVADLATQLDFWTSKESLSPGNIVYQKKIAGLLAARFGLQHDIDDLKESDRILENLLASHPNDVGLLHSLIGNSITQHKFNAAQDYAARAYDIGEHRMSSQLMLVDIYLEKGMFADAASILEESGEKDRFDRQIRYVKLLDAKGDLDAAVTTMESALTNAKETKSNQLMTWAYSNLGDMYGHQGRIRESYQAYLMTLAIDPAHEHALKGIGWIAYSHDSNLVEAERIWTHLAKRSENPEYDLLLARLYEQLGNEASATAYKNTFISKTMDSRYGNMYGAYLVDLLPRNQAQEALALANMDLEEREHPVTYSHYALALYHAGNLKEAQKVLDEQVISRTEEPNVFYIAGIIYDEAGRYSEARSMYKEALDASYELGPDVSAEIRSRLKAI